MFSILIASLYITLQVFKKLSARAFCKTVIVPKKTVLLDDVAIFQPILSGDANLPSTLESNLLILKGACFYWLVDDEDPVGHEIVDELINRHQDKNIVKLSFPEAPESIHPKLFKLNAVLPQCQQDYCIVLDDDTTLPEPSLQMMLAELAHCELVTGLPQYREHGNFYSRLLAAFVNNNASFTYLSLLPYMKPITINGMCYGVKREQFNKIGGFEPILRCLTDDLAMAEHVLSHGGKIRQTSFTQLIATSVDGAKHYAKQMHRWYVFANVLFFKQNNKIKAIIFSLYGLPSLLLLSLWFTLFFDFSVLSALALLITLIVRQWIISGSIKGFLISVLSENLQTIHLLHAFSSKKIRWRNRFYRVDSNSQFASIKK